MGVPVFNSATLSFLDFLCIVDHVNLDTKTYTDPERRFDSTRWILRF